MNHHPLTRALPHVVLFALVFAACKLENTTVGSDGAAGGAAGGGGQSSGVGGAGTSILGCPGVHVCNEPMVPSGCTLGPASCVDGQYTCPEVVCPSSTRGTSCVASGGTCTGTGAASCTKRAPSTVDDCNPPPVNPGGSFCCLDETADAGACVNIDLTTYDTTCTQASDCAAIRAGEFCRDACTCGNAAVNASEYARYEKAISSVGASLACPCVALFGPECVGGKCVVCNSPTGCAAVDAGSGAK